MASRKFNAVSFITLGALLTTTLVFVSITMSLDEKYRCADLFIRNNTQYKAAVETARIWKPDASAFGKPLDELFFASNESTETFDCSEIINTIGLLTSKPLSDAEASFPLAFAMLIHTNFEQFLFLLRRIFMPQNIYCLHVDAKSTSEFLSRAQKIELCLPNVFLARKRETVYWGQPSVLMAAHNCLAELNDRRQEHDWKYVQILSETDFPLKTNAEMVQIFTLLNGTNDCELARENPWRIAKQLEQHHPPPAGMRIYKGSFAASMTREFVAFMMNNSVARDFLEWVKDTGVADEKYWSTLTHNPQIGAPGSFPGDCVEEFEKANSGKPYISRYQVWSGERFGRWIRGSCEFGVGDLVKMLRQPHLIAHKFSLDFEPAALYCLDEIIRNRTYGPESSTYEMFQRDYYSALPSVRYANLENKSSFSCL